MSMLLQILEFLLDPTYLRNLLTGLAILIAATLFGLFILNHRKRKITEQITVNVETQKVLQLLKELKDAQDLVLILISLDQSK